MSDKDSAVHGGSEDTAEDTERMLRRQYNEMKALAEEFAAMSDQFRAVLQEIEDADMCWECEARDIAARALGHRAATR